MRFRKLEVGKRKRIYSPKILSGTLRNYSLRWHEGDAGTFAPGRVARGKAVSCAALLSKERAVASDPSYEGDRRGAGGLLSPNTPGGRKKCGRNLLPSRRGDCEDLRCKRNSEQRKSVRSFSPEGRTRE